MTLPNCLQLRQASLCRDRHPYSVVSGCCTNCENMVTTWAAVTSILTISLSWGRCIIVSQRSCLESLPTAGGKVANLHPADSGQAKWSQKWDRLMKLYETVQFEMFQLSQEKSWPTIDQSIKKYLVFSTDLQLVGPAVDRKRMAAMAAMEQVGQGQVRDIRVELSSTVDWDRWRFTKI